MFCLGLSREKGARASYLHIAYDVDFVSIQLLFGIEFGHGCLSAACL